MPVYYGRNGRKYQIDDEYKSGGEGSICKIAGDNDHLAKIYINADDAERARLKAKILAMLDMNFSPYQKNGHMIVAWPVDILLDAPNGKCCGLVMPFVKGMETITTVKRERDARRLFPSYDRTFPIRVAHNLCNVVEILHSRGFIIGDMNPNNILVKNDRQVTIVDADSFEFEDETGKVHRCTALRPDCVAPELQGKRLTETGSHVTQESDRFSLALHIFELLNNYSHPFCCPIVNPNQSSSAHPTRIDNIAMGRTPYVTGATMAIQRTAPDQRIFTPEYRQLLDRVFTYDVYSAVKKETQQRRPTATEWRAVLASMLQEWTGSNATHCADATHVYPRRYGSTCPWCNIVLRQNRTAPDIRADGTPATATPATPTPATPPPKPATSTPVTPIPMAKPVETPVTPPTNPNLPHGTFLLYVVCILLALAGGVWCAPGIADMLGGSQDLAVIASIITGLISGAGVAIAVEDDYRWADTSWPYYLWAFAGIVISALLTTAVVFIGNLFV